jgi:hypothetical protein
VLLGEWKSASDVLSSPDASIADVYSTTEQLSRRLLEGATTVPLHCLSPADLQRAVSARLDGVVSDNHVRRQLFAHFSATFAASPSAS